MSLKNKTFSAALWTGISISSSGMLRYLAIIIMARFVTPSEYGVVALTFIIVAFSNIFIDGGLGPALIQKSNINTLHVRNAFTITMLLGGGLLFITYIGSSDVALFFSEPRLESVLKLLSFIFIIKAVGTPAKALLLRRLQFKRLMLINASSIIIGYIFVGTILAAKGYAYWAFIYATLVFSFTYALLVLVVVRHNIIPIFTKKEFLELVNFGSGLTLSRFFNFIGNNGDKIIISKVSGTELLGSYDMAFKLMMLPVKNIGRLIDQVMFPILSKVSRDSIKSGDIFLKTIAFSLLVIVPISSFMLIMANELVVSILGQQWVSIILPFQILLFAANFKIILRVCDSLVRAKGAVYKSAIRKFLYACIVIFCAWIGAQWGEVGVALGVNVAIIGVSILMLNLCLKLLESIDFQDLVIASLPALILGLITSTITYIGYYFNSMLFSSELQILSMTTLSTLILSLVVIYSFPTIVGSTGRWLLFQLTNKYKSKFSIVEKFEERLKMSGGYSFEH